MKRLLLIFLLISLLTTLTIAKYDGENHKNKIKTRHFVHVVHHRHRAIKPNVKINDENQGNTTKENTLALDLNLGLFAFEDVASQTAIVVDLNLNLTYILNKDNGNEITLKNGQSSTTTTNVWSSNQNLTQLLENLRSQPPTNGQQSDPNQENQLIKNLGVTKDDLQKLQNEILKLRQVKSHPQVNPTKLTLSNVIHRLEGLEHLGAIKTLKQFDLKILSARNAFEALLSILQNIDVNIDIKSLADILNDAEKLFEALTKLSNSNDPIDNVIRSIQKFVGVIRGRIPLDVFIKFLINEAANGDLIVDGNVIKEYLQDIIKIVENLNKNHNAPLSGFLQILQSILNQSFILDGVNFTDLLRSLREKDPRGVIFNIVHILIQIGSNINPIHTIPILVENIMKMINSTGGINIINKLIPNLDTSLIENIPNPLGEILKHVNIVHLLEKSPLTQIPVVGQILQVIGLAIETFGGPQAVIKDLHSGTLIRHIPIIGQILGLIGSIPGPPQIIESLISNVEKGVGGVLGGVAGIGDGNDSSTTDSSGDETTTKGAEDRHAHKVVKARHKVERNLKKI